MRIAFCELPDGFGPQRAAWDRMRDDIAQARPDVLLMNEMPFGHWLAASASYNANDAQASVRLHESGFARTREWEVPLIIASRPVPAGGRLRNRAVCVSEGVLRAAHEKRYLPQQAGYFERSWFEHGADRLQLFEHGPLRIGVLMCTELMFNESARKLRALGANLILVPRTSGQLVHPWTIAASMAAIVSGCYVISSNRCGEGLQGQLFGGFGFAVSPSGKLIGRTSSFQPVASVDIDLSLVAAAQRSWPCNVPEIEAA